MGTEMAGAPDERFMRPFSTALAVIAHMQDSPCDRATLADCCARLPLQAAACPSASR